MLAGLAIETMGDRDVPAVARLDATSFPMTRDPDADVAERVARFREELARPWSHTWVARAQDGEPVAFLLAWLVADELHVLNVATHPAHRRCGVAARLVATAIDFARARGAIHLRLEVRRGNTGALRLYRAAGFFAVAIRRDYYPDHEDAIDMDLLLEPGTGRVVAREDETRVDP